jgi:hypothetical protein
MNAPVTSQTQTGPSQGTAGTPTYAPQPKDPGTDCDGLPAPPTPPSLPDPKPCAPQCTCPSAPPENGSCFDPLIAQQAKEAAMGDAAKDFKKELETLLAAAKAAKADYTLDKYQDLLKRWQTEDDNLVALLKKLTCALPCWWCVVECEICPLLYSIRALERQLNGTYQPIDSADSLYDLAYWWTRERDRRQDVFSRIKAVMGAWATPNKTIDKALADNAKLISDAGNVLGPNSPTVLFDVFFRIVQLHLAIAPPASSGYTTKIEQQWVALCACDEDGTPDDCCGPNVGPLSMRARIIGPQPYLIPPDEYFPLMCCLVSTRYQPAKKALDDANSELANANAAIAKAIADIAAKQKSLPQDAKTALSKTIDCCNDYKPKPPTNGDGGGCGPSGGTGTPTPSTAKLT